MKHRGYKRGYPVAVLAGLEKDHAVLWQIYSQVAKHQQTITLNSTRKDTKTLYTFHETIINELRPNLKEGVKSLLIASPPKTSYGQDFLNHIKTRHTWLVQGQNKAALTIITGQASTPQQVATITKTSQFKELIHQTADQENDNLLEIFEKRLTNADNLVFFSLEEAEGLIFNVQASGKPKPEYLVLTNAYLSGSRQKNRVHRLMQIAQNKQVKTRVIDAESKAGKRIAQLGGIVCLAK